MQFWILKKRSAIFRFHKFLDCMEHSHGYTCIRYVYTTRLSPSQASFSPNELTLREEVSDEVVVCHVS